MTPAPEPAGQYPPLNDPSALRSRLDKFISRHVSLAGAIHRNALGWDVLTAPVNIALAVPNLVMKLAAAAAQRIVASRISGYLGIASCHAS